MNERIKNFEILSHIPQQFRHISTKIFQVCAMLVNFQNPMIAEIANNYSFDQWLFMLVNVKKYPNQC